MTNLTRNVFLVFYLSSFPSWAMAEEIKIVAMGASQTHGKGVPQSDAYPAQLERILRAEGYSVSVANEGKDGDTTRILLSRLNRAVPDGTKIVILQPGTNDKMHTNRRSALSPEETKNNVKEILARLRERNITAVLLGYPEVGGRGNRATILCHLVWPA